MALRRDGLLCGRLLGRGSRGGLGSGLCLCLGLGVEAADLQLALILFQNAFIVVLPELLRGVLAGDSLKNLLAT